MIYPDITILFGDELVGIVEVKNDLGYMSEDWANQSRKKLEKLRNAELVTYKEHVNTKIKERVIPLHRTKEFNQIVVVISGINGHGKIDSLKSNHTCFVLMPHHHPNNPIHDEELKEIINDNSGWIELGKHLAKHYA
ncbi:MAG: hypothetical protein A2081_06175 [Elusimicrobia bacterium GWC2_61_19]|nr:MAG: hypothetical protein A2081_06175 [Elusimicrobia bacterium GWC2_61_19]